LFHTHTHTASGIILKVIVGVTATGLVSVSYERSAQHGPVNNNEGKGKR